MRVDDDLTIDDKSIERMIKSAFDFIERKTNVIMSAKTKTYILDNGCKRVYDAPIIAVISPETITQDRRTTYSIFTSSNTADIVLKLQVGYINSADVPADLIDVAYELIDLMYYQHETGKNVVKDLSALSERILDSNKRFLF